MWAFRTAVRLGAIAGSRTFTVDWVDESAICASVRESKPDCISWCNKAQVILYMDGSKDVLSSVSLFGLVVDGLDERSCEIWRILHRRADTEAPEQMKGDTSQPVVISAVGSVLTLLSHVVAAEFKDLRLKWSTLHGPGIYDFTEETFTLKTLGKNKKSLDNWNGASIVFPALFSLDSIKFDYFLFCYDRNLVSVNKFFFFNWTRHETDWNL